MKNIHFTTTYIIQNIMKLSFFETNDDAITISEKILKLNKKIKDLKYQQKERKGIQLTNDINNLKEQIEDLRMKQKVLLEHGIIRGKRPRIKTDFSVYYDLKEITSSIRDKTCMSNDIADRLSLNITSFRKIPVSPPRMRKQTKPRCDGGRFCEDEAEETEEEYSSSSYHEESTDCDDEELARATEEVNRIFTSKQHKIDESFNNIKLKILKKK